MLQEGAEAKINFKKKLDNLLGNVELEFDDKIYEQIVKFDDAVAARKLRERENRKNSRNKKKKSKKEKIKKEKVKKAKKKEKKEKEKEKESKDKESVEKSREVGAGGNTQLTTKEKEVYFSDPIRWNTAEHFEFVISHLTPRNHFHLFLNKVFSSENLYFIEAVNQYKTSPPPLLPLAKNVTFLSSTVLSIIKFFSIFLDL